MNQVSHQMNLMMKMGYIDPITEIITPQQQQRIYKLFRFGTEEEKEVINESVVTNKTKSLTQQGDNPTNQRRNNNKIMNDTISRRIKRKMLSLKRKSNKSSNIK